MAGGKTVAFGLAALAWLGLAEAEEAPAERPVTEITTGEIARELNKWPGWLKGYIETDYTNAGREGHATIRMMSRAAQEMEKKRGIRPSDAAYYPETDTVILPEPENEEVERETLGGIHHELTHTLHDDVGRKGLFFWEGYSGPTPEQLAAYTTKKIATPEFARRQHDGMVERAYEELKRGVASYLFTSFTLLQRLPDQSADIVEAFQELQDLDVSEEDQNRVHEVMQRIRKEAPSFEEKRERVEASLNANQKTFDLLEKGCDTMEQKEEVISVLQPILREGTTLLHHPAVKAFQEAHQTLGETVIRTKKQYYRERIREVRAQLNADPDDPEAKAAFEALRIEVTAYAEAQKAVQEETSRGAAFLEHLEETYQLLNRTVGEVNIKQIEEAFSQPYEVFARMVESLVTLYTGPVSKNLFPLTEEDLTFLERFIYKGEKLFGELTEKYRLAQQLRADGYTEEQVAEAFWLTNQFRYKGKTYRWTTPGVEIRGKIPFEEE